MENDLEAQKLVMQKLTEKKIEGSIEVSKLLSLHLGLLNLREGRRQLDLLSGRGNVEEDDH